jgi:hypothetical protein
MDFLYPQYRRSTANLERSLAGLGMNEVVVRNSPPRKAATTNLLAGKVGYTGVSPFRKKSRIMGTRPKETRTPDGKRSLPHGWFQRLGYIPKA